MVGKIKCECRSVEYRFQKGLLHPHVFLTVLSLSLRSKCPARAPCQLLGPLPQIITTPALALSALSTNNQLSEKRG